MDDGLTPSLDERLERLTDWQGDAESAVTEAIAIYNEAAYGMAELKSYQSEAEAAIDAIIEETGCIDWQTDAGRAIRTKDSVRVSYDTKALDALAASDSNVARLLSPHRKEKTVSGYTVIKTS